MVRDIPRIAITLSPTFGIGMAIVPQVLLSDMLRVEDMTLRLDVEIEDSSITPKFYNNEGT